jgi:hypothetical protein
VLGAAGTRRAADREEVGQRPRLDAEVGAGLVATHEDDLLRAEALGREDGQQPDGAAAVHGHAGALVTVGKGDLVVSPFAISDGTCESW